MLAKLPGTAAIGHTRYSTAGDKALLNAQPIMIDCNKGKVALGHNGNLTNAAEWRRKLEHRGSIFQTNSDTEVIVHLIARSQARNLSGAIGDALNQVEGAYSLLVLTPDELYAVRDPRGFRPLVLGKLGDSAGSGGLPKRARSICSTRNTFAKSSPAKWCASRESGIESIRFAPAKAASALRFRARLFLAARQHYFRPLREREPRSAGPLAGAASIPSMRTSSFRCPTPACPRRLAMRWNPASHFAWA